MIAVSPKRLKKISSPAKFHWIPNAFGILITFLISGFKSTLTNSTPNSKNCRLGSEPMEKMKMFFCFSSNSLRTVIFVHKSAVVWQNVASPITSVYTEVEAASSRIDFLPLPIQRWCFHLTVKPRDWICYLLPYNGRNMSKIFPSAVVLFRKKFSFTKSKKCSMRLNYKNLFVLW